MLQSAALIGMVAVMTCAWQTDSARPRGTLDNSRLKFSRDKSGHVVFMGGSITEMDGYRPIMMESLKRRFPETSFQFTNAGVSSTCSTTGAFRLADEVLAKGPVDLIFVEFAVNDDQDAHHAKRECVRGMEGIVRHLRVHNPNCDIVMVHFVNEGMLSTIAKGQEPLSSGAHEEVASRHGISSAHVARELAAKIKDGSFTWARYGGVHPAKPGNELAASVVNRILDKAWTGPLPKAASPHPTAELLDPVSYVRGRFLDNNAVARGEGWDLSVPDWKKLMGDCRSRFRSLPLLHSEKHGSVLTAEFTGRAIGAYLLAGPDAGVAEISIDGGPFRAVPLKHPYSKGLHYPRTVVLASDLEDKPHVARIRVAPPVTPMDGSAIRIVRLGVD